MAKKPKLATMTLPAGAAEAWTRLMQEEEPLPDSIEPGSPIVMAHARFKDGTQVIAGVARGPKGETYNTKFAWVFDANGKRYAGWPIDVSDHQDFDTRSLGFYLDENEEQEYVVKLVEAAEPASASQKVQKA